MSSKTCYRTPAFRDTEAFGRRVARPRVAEFGGFDRLGTPIVRFRQLRRRPCLMRFCDAAVAEILEHHFRDRSRGCSWRICAAWRNRAGFRQRTSCRCAPSGLGRAAGFGTTRCNSRGNLRRGRTPGWCQAARRKFPPRLGQSMGQWRLGPAGSRVGLGAAQLEQLAQLPAALEQLVAQLVIWWSMHGNRRDPSCPE